MKKGKIRHSIDAPVYEFGPPHESNPIVSLLESHGVVRSQMNWLMAKASEIEGLPSKFDDYKIHFLGVSPDAGYSTPMSFGYGQEEKILDVWEVAISWGDADCYAAAVWSRQRADFIVSIELGGLKVLNRRAAIRRATDGLALIRWAQDRFMDRTDIEGRSRTEALKRNLLEAAASMGREPKKPRQRIGLHIQPLAKRAGYGKQTVYDLLEAEPEFKSELEAAYDAARGSHGDS